jgi:hypothetical protein
MYKCSPPPAAYLLNNLIQIISFEAFVQIILAGYLTLGDVEKDVVYLQYFI